MVDHPAARFRPRGRMGSGLLYILSVCAIGGDAIYAESDPAAEVPEYCTVFHHQVGNGAKKVAAPNNGGLHDETVNQSEWHNTYSTHRVRWGHAWFMKIAIPHVKLSHLVDREVRASNTPPTTFHQSK